MKKLIISMLMIASCFGVANAQLLVDENGKVGVVYDGAGPLSSELSIGTSGNSNATVSVMSAKGMGMYINHYPMSSSSNNYGIYNINYSVANVTNYGIYTDLSGSSSNGTKNIGIYARVSGTSSSGSNYGLYGYLSSTGHGTGVFGSTAKYLGMTFPNLTGNYAGFFYGDACITGALTVGYVNQTSDYRLKENIRSLTDSDGCLEKVIGMNVVEYNLKQREFELNITEQDKADEAAREAEIIARGIDPQEITKRKQKTENRALWYEEDSPIIRNKHYGLIAQELQEIYPTLVTENQDGYLAINYTEIIPLLIRSIQELNAKVEQYENGNAPVQKAQARNTDVSSIDAVVTTLYQNTPNPFTESTLIQCDVAEAVVDADLYIYDMNGKQIDTYPITERGATSITIEGHSLEAGMYLYALIADGQVIDTKRMILTK